MINLIPLHNVTKIKDVLKTDNLYKTLFWDVVDLTDWLPNPKIHWFLIKLNSDLIGILLVQPGNNQTKLFHGGLFKKYRGKASVTILKECLIKLKHLYDVQFITSVKQTNKPAIKLLKKAGFHPYIKFNDIQFFVE